MAKLPGTIYVKPAGKSTDILTFGKSDELTASDTEKGVARFGGWIRQPCYGKAYYRSAQVLLDNALENSELDEFGLPIFYMIRHAVELRIKGLLSFCIEILQLRHDVYPKEFPASSLPSNRKKKLVDESHDINKLIIELKVRCSELDVNFPESEFDSVTEMISEFEINPTWSRYSRSRDGSHTEGEIVLPIVSLFNNLALLENKVSYCVSSDNESIESELNSLFTLYTSILEQEKC